MDKMAEAKEILSGLSAVRKAMKNGDMFSEDLFKEKFMVGVILQCTKCETLSIANCEFCIDGK